MLTIYGCLVDHRETGCNRFWGTEMLQEGESCRSLINTLGKYGAKIYPDCRDFEGRFRVNRNGASFEAIMQSAGCYKCGIEASRVKFK